MGKIVWLSAVLSILMMPKPALSVVLYGGNGNASNAGYVVIVDQSTGVGSLLGQPSADGITGLAFDGFSQLWGSTHSHSGDSLLHINPANGALLSSTATSLAIGDLAFQPNTNVLFAITNSGDLYTINTSTGVGSLKGTAGSKGGLAFAPDGTLYLTGVTDSGNALFTLNPGTGAILTSVSLTNFYDGLGIRYDGTIYGVTGQISGGDAIYTISASGVETLVGSTGTGKLSDLDFTPAPEPATWALAGLGLIGLISAKRKTGVID